MSNTNCLEGVRCPECGHEDGFYISALVELYVVDDGTEDQGGDHEWEGGSPCRCGGCGHQATVHDFYIENQEALHLQLAAQDLLAALEAIFKWWTETSAFQDGDDEMPAEIFDAVRFAIAKAKGGAA